MCPDLAVVNISQMVTNSGCVAGKPIDEDSIGLVHDAAMLVEGGRVIWVGTMKEYKTKTLGKPARTLDAAQRLVTPGFVDPHTHLIFAGGRQDEFDRKIKGESYKRILSSGGGILRTIRATRDSSNKILLIEALDRLLQLKASGVTTVEVKSGYGQDLANEVKMISVANQLGEMSGVEIINTFLGLHAVPPECKSANDYTKFVINNILPEIAKLPHRPKFSDCFCESDLFSRDFCSRYLKASALLGFNLKIHADEFSESGGAELAANLGCTSADHLENSTEEGLKAMAEKGVVAVLLPSTALYSSIRPADADRIQKNGCVLSLGTDLSPNSWVESPQLVMLLACTTMRMSIAQALAAFTWGASLALGRSDLGRLVQGAKADFTIHEYHDYRYLPYRVGGRYVTSVYKAGKEIYRNPESDTKPKNIGG
jgi:imidazolonepropionase